MDGIIQDEDKRYNVIDEACEIASHYGWKLVPWDICASPVMFDAAMEHGIKQDGWIAMLCAVPKFCITAEQESAPQPKVTWYNGFPQLSVEGSDESSEKQETVTAEFIQEIGTKHGHGYGYSFQDEGEGRVIFYGDEFLDFCEELAKELNAKFSATTGVAENGPIQIGVDFAAPEDGSPLKCNCGSTVYCDGSCTSPAYTEEPKVVRTGYMLVPIEPTEEMLDAGRDAGDFHIMHYDGMYKPGTPRYSLRASWAAMIAAAKGA